MTQAARDGYPHLPADVEPGPQSLRARSSARWGRVVVPIAAAIFAVVIVNFIGAVGGGVPVFPLVIVAAVAVFALGRGLLRRPLRGVTVAVEPQHTARGGRVTATVRVDRELGDLEVGLVCVAAYDRIERSTSSSSSSSSRRVTRHETVFAQWAPASAGAFDTSVELEVPTAAPYSYEGTCLSFAWSARARRAGRRRTSAPEPLWVDA